jgi:creatinine amidohydrolase
MQQFYALFRAICGLSLALFACSAALALAPKSSVYLEDLTSVEVADMLRAGSRSTVIIPVGGTEQNGPHMALGKHNARMQVLAGKIAAELGNAVVAPVLAYVPEGNVSPPTEHMRFAGTISVPEAAFKSILAGAAQSFRQHGFKHVVLLGDSGNYQHLLKAVAADLNRDWARAAAPNKPQAHFIAEYYQAGQTAYLDALKARGITKEQIGSHAGLADTALLMATKPGMVKPEQFARAAQDGRSTGTNGDPRASSAELGQLGVDAIVKRTVEAIARVTRQ